MGLNNVDPPISTKPNLEDVKDHAGIWVTEKAYQTLN